MQREAGSRCWIGLLAAEVLLYNALRGGRSPDPLKRCPRVCFGGPGKESCWFQESRELFVEQQTMARVGGVANRVGDCRMRIWRWADADLALGVAGGGTRRAR